AGGQTSASPLAFFGGRSFPSPDESQRIPESPRRSFSGIAKNPDVVADGVGKQRPCRWLRPRGRTATWFRSGHSRDSDAQGSLGATAEAVGFDRGPESDSSRPRTSPEHGLVGSDKDRRCRGPFL